MPNRNGRAVIMIFIPFIVGMSGLFTLMQRPRFEMFHTVDVLQLLASGMCFGIAFIALLTMLRGRPRQ